MAETEDEIMDHLVHVRSALDATREGERELRRPFGAPRNRYLSMSCLLYPSNSRIERRIDLADA
jgi:hypothetical protein